MLYLILRFICILLLIISIALFSKKEYKKQEKIIIFGILILSIILCIISFVLYNDYEERRDKRSACSRTVDCDCKDNEEMCSCKYVSYDNDLIKNVNCPNNRLKRGEE